MLGHLSKWPRRLVPASILVALAAGLAVPLLRRAAARPAPLIVRCPLHGIAYDPELEVCPECVKPPAAD